MSATKLPIIIGLVGKVEASYNAGGALSTATDGIQLAGPATPTPEYAFDGGRRGPPGTGGHQRRLKPHGKACSVPVQHEAKGPGVAYTASVLPSVHTLLRIAGFDAAVDTTATLEKVTYTPTPGQTGFASGVFDAYGRGQKFPLTGAYADLRITADDDNAPLWEFMLKTLHGAVSDVAVPAITYPALSIDPPKSTNIGFTLGNFVNGVVRKWSFSLGRQIGARRNQNGSTGHGGFSPSGRPARTPTMEVTVEATSLQATPFHAASAIDPYRLYEEGTELDASIAIWGAQYNKWKMKPGKVQLMAPPVEDEDEGGALWTLLLQCNPTALNANDDVSFIFE